MRAFSWGAATETGQVREVNQDNLLIADGLFAVADGMGGHLGGEVASDVAVTTMRRHGGEGIEALIEAVRTANAAIVERALDEPRLRGMGTTLCAIALVGDDEGDERLAVVNVGDSRVYRFASDQLEQVTQDHSLVEGLVRDGILSREEALVHPQRNILTRALGVDLDLDVDWWEVPLRSGDRFVLCSDGLFNEISDAEIAETLRGFDDPEAAARELVHRANEAGGRDNITVVVVDVLESGPDRPDALEAPQVARASGTLEPGDPVASSAALRSDSPEQVQALAAEVVDVLEQTSAPPDESRIERILDEPVPSRRILNWRFAIFVLCVLLVIAFAVAAIGVYARASYFVGVRDDQVVIFQGRPGGVLWFDPTLSEPTSLSVDDLSEALRAEVDNNPRFASLDGARGYVVSLEARVDPVEDVQDDLDDEAGTLSEPVATPTPDG